MQFTVLTLFPDIITSYTDQSILKRGQDNSAITINAINIRDFATDKHKTVDDTPYGGGAGMVMKVEPIHRAVQQATNNDLHKKKIVVMSAGGKQFTQQQAAEYAELDQLILICGRYEGIDQRVIDHIADEEVSVGPYVLAGGELPALTILEATARLIPGVLGNPASLAEESHNTSPQSATPKNTPVKEYPQYTKPETYEGWDVPPVLLSGNHKAISQWRSEQQE